MGGKKSSLLVLFIRLLDNSFGSNRIIFFSDNELIPLEEVGEDESPFLTLEEAEKLALEKKELVHSKQLARELKNQVSITFLSRYIIVSTILITI